MPNAHGSNSATSSATVESGRLTKDLAVLIDAKAPWLTTEQGIDALAGE